MMSEMSDRAQSYSPGTAQASTDSTGWKISLALCANPADGSPGKSLSAECSDIGGTWTRKEKLKNGAVPRKIHLSHQERGLWSFVLQRHDDKSHFSRITLKCLMDTRDNRSGNCKKKAKKPPKNPKMTTKKAQQNKEFLLWVIKQNSSYVLCTVE